MPVRAKACIHTRGGRRGRRDRVRRGGRKNISKWMGGKESYYVLQAAGHLHITVVAASTRECRSLTESEQNLGAA